MRPPKATLEPSCETPFCGFFSPLPRESLHYAIAAGHGAVFPLPSLTRAESAASARKIRNISLPLPRRIHREKGTAAALPVLAIWFAHQLRRHRQFKNEILISGAACLTL
jgi:hypothetical protein